MVDGVLETNAYKVRGHTFECRETVCKLSLLYTTPVPEELGDRLREALGRSTFSWTITNEGGSRDLLTNEEAHTLTVYMKHRIGAEAEAAAAGRQ
jgi:hypothetical protein